MPDRARALEAAARARLILLLGDSDTGKTTLAARLATDLAARGRAVAVVDADLGQSEIGPPTTVGLGRVEGPLTRLADVKPMALAFVGSTSPARDLVTTVVATARLVEAAKSDRFAHVIVDTSGLVAGDLGRRLKQAKIDLVRPDLIVCLQRDRECEHILHPYRGDPGAIVRLPAAPLDRRRSPTLRRRHRESALARYFGEATSCLLDLGRVVIRSPALFVGEPIPPRDLADLGAAAGETFVWGERRGREAVVVSQRPLTEASARRIRTELGAGMLEAHAVDDLVGTITGLDDAAGRTLGIGVLSAVDFPARTLIVDTPVAPDAVATATLGRERYRPNGAADRRPAVDSAPRTLY